jgi:hypothetical protein
MSIEVNSSFINHVLDKWDKEETTELLDALRVELRRDLRGANKKDAPIFESIIEQIDEQNFWVMLAVIYGYKFNP